MEQIHKQIISYLPYGVKCEILNYKSDYVGLRYSTLNGFYHIIGEPHFTYDGGSTGKSIRDMKIILRPFSDITKEIEVNGEKFVPSEKIGIHLFDYDFMYIYRKETNGIPFWVVQKLLEWNFDLYGLIESDNAIDINTL